MRILRAGGYRRTGRCQKSPRTRPAAPRTVPDCAHGRGGGRGEPGRRILGVAVLGLWAVWAVLSWLSAARFVTDEQFHADLDAGRIRTWRLATELHPTRAWPPTGTGSWDYGTLAQRASDGLPATW